MPNKQHTMHGRDHEHGAADPSLIHWDATTLGGGGIQFDTDNVGGWLMVETTTTCAVDFSEASGLTLFGDSATNYSLAINTENGIVLTADPAANAWVLSIIEEVDSTHGARGLIIETSADGSGLSFGLEAQSNANTGIAIGLSGLGSSHRSGGLGLPNAYGVDGAGHTYGNDYAIGVRGQAVALGPGTGRAVGVLAYAESHTPADAIGIRATASHQGGGTGARIPIQVIQDSTNARIFEVRDDGSVHGLASVGAITWDL